MSIMSQVLFNIALTAGLNVNTNGGMYRNGKEYVTEKKAEVAFAYFRLKGALGKVPSDRILAKEAHVGKSFAAKVKKEIADGGAIVTVEDLKSERHDRRKKGVGCI